MRPGRQPRAQRAHAPAVAGGEHDRLRPGRGGDVRGLRDRVAGEVALRAHDQDLDAAAARERDEALEPAEVEVHVQRGGDEAQVHVGGQRLLARVVVGAREQRAPRQDVADRLASAQRDPVAGGGQLGRPAGGRLQRARGGHERVDRLAADRIAAAVHCGHARRDQRAVVMVGEGLRPFAVPPEGGEVQLGAPSLGGNVRRGGPRGAAREAG